MWFNRSVTGRLAEASRTPIEYLVPVNEIEENFRYPQVSPLTDASPRRPESNLKSGISVATLGRTTARVGAENFKQEEEDNRPTAYKSSLRRCPIELFRAKSFCVHQKLLIDRLREKVERYHEDVKRESHSQKTRLASGSDDREKHRKKWATKVDVVESSSTGEITKTGMRPAVVFNSEEGTPQCDDVEKCQGDPSAYQFYEGTKSHQEGPKGHRNNDASNAVLPIGERRHCEAPRPKGRADL